MEDGTVCTREQIGAGGGASFSESREMVQKHEMFPGVRNKSDRSCMHSNVMHSQFNFVFIYLLQ